MAVGLVAMLLLYPLILAQIGILVQRLPVYVGGHGQAAARRAAAARGSARAPRWWTQRLRDMAINQAGAMLSWIVHRRPRG